MADNYSFTYYKRLVVFCGFLVHVSSVPLSTDVISRAAATSSVSDVTHDVSVSRDHVELFLVELYTTRGPCRITEIALCTNGQ